MTQPSVFTKIINRELPAHIVYEDDQVIAFLSIAPIATGHVVLVPKEQIARVWDMPEALYTHAFSVARRIAEKQREVYAPDRVGLIVDGGITTDHAHINILQLNDSEDIHATPQQPSSDELAAEAAKLRL